MKKFIKIITLLLAVAFCFSVFGCGSRSSSKNKDSIIEDKVTSLISTKIYLEYGKTPASVTCYIKLTDSSYDKEEYYVKGKVTVYDMGDKYVGEYTATAYYYLDDGDVSVPSSSVNIGKLYKK